MEPYQLKQMQSLSFEAKVARAERRIHEFVDSTGGLAYLAWSGGLDSRVVLWLLRERCGISRERVPAVFTDTGLEYPEVRECALRHADVVLKPDLDFLSVLKKYGYPVVSKKVAQYVGEVQSCRRHGHPDAATVRLRTTGMTSRGTFSELARVPKKWQRLFDAPFRISCKCCDVMKKNPAKRYAKETGRAPILGLRAEDSRQREKTFLFARQGSCNVLREMTGPKGRFDQAHASSWPIAIWTDADVRRAVSEFGLDHPSLYDEGADSTGCAFCAFGAHMEKGENRFQRMERRHPQLHRYCMEKLGMREVLEYVGVPWTNAGRHTQEEIV